MPSLLPLTILFLPEKRFAQSNNMLLSSPNDQSWYSVILLALVVYSSTVRLLRYRRSDALIKKYAPAGQASFQRLSNTEAQAVLKNLAELEFPALYGASMVIANIRTYGIPSISSVLVQSGQLGHVDNASKRAADTGVLLLEFGLNKPTSKRAIEAVARMNYLHSKWQRAGKIMNDE